jgi:aminomethyltransferase
MLRRTPLHEEHRALGAKLVPFAGWEMPVQYPAGITAEHHAVRRAAGLFDVSHMGEVDVRGPQALDLLQHVTSNDVAKIEIGQAQYGALLTERGTVLDDLIIYRMPDRYMAVVNGAGRERDVAWLLEQAAGFDVEVVDRSDDLALLALQGPAAEGILQPLTETPLSEIAYYRFREGDVAGVPAIISRTGYTGELGFELYVPAARAAELWRALLAAGEPHGLLPAGLGARDSLRLEMGYVLYGSDVDENRTPLEAGLAWVTKLDKGEFLGSGVLRRQKAEGVAERLAGFRLLDRGFPRHGYEIRLDGDRVGEVSSGTMSPSLGCGIGLGYVAVAAARPGTRVEIVIRGQPVAAEIVRPPFYAGGSAKG